MRNPLRIVATEPIPPVAHELLDALGELVEADIADERALARAEVLIVRTATVDAAVLGRAPALRAIARTGVGLDKIDLGAASRHGVPVLFAPDASAGPIAEGTLALIFAASKRLRELGAILGDGRWSERYDVEPRDLAGATLGVVGLGRIGSEVARLARAIGMNVIACEPRLAGEAPHPTGARLVDLAQLFREADVITLHCSLTDETRGLVGRELLASAKPGAVLVNASRGAIVDGDALLTEALDRGWLSSVGLDVFAVEPPPADALLVRDPRVVCTPHTIGLTRAWNERVFGSLAADVRLLLAGERPRNVANPEVFDAVTETI
jgi:D-3-phosphoglycerate dehydrogenase